MKRAACTLLALYALAGLPFSVSAADGARAEIARLYLQAAEEAVLHGSFDRASDLAALAREYDPDSADVRFLSALVEFADRTRTRRALDRIEELTASGGLPRRYAEVDVLLLYGRLLSRVGRHREAVAALESVNLAVPGLPKATDLLVRTELISGLVALGRRADADRLLRLALDRHPDDPGLYRLALLAEPYPSLEHRRRIELLIGSPAAAPERSLHHAASLAAGLPSDGPLARLVLLYAERAPTSAERDWAVGEYLAHGGRDPGVALVYASDRPARAVELYRSLDGHADLGVTRALLRALAGAASPGASLLASDISAELDVYTGHARRDDRRDGLWSEEVTVRDGSIIRWARDEDRDGEPEVVIDFDQMPVGAFVRGGLEPAVGEVRLSFGQYPFVATATIRREDGAERFVLRPRALRYDLLDGLTSRGARYADLPDLLRPLRAVTRSELLASAAAVELSDERERLYERTILENGVAARRMVDTSRNGSWDHLVVLKDGVPVAAVRDLTADGTFEIAEGYFDGRLVAIAVDENGDGAPNLFEHDGTRHVREWDLDGDGVIDVREFLEWTERVIREFPFLERAW